LPSTSKLAPSESAASSFTPCRLPHTQDARRAAVDADDGLVLEQAHITDTLVAQAAVHASQPAAMMSVVDLYI